MSRSEVITSTTTTHIVGNDIENYREIDRLSYSALKQYVEDRKKYKLLYIDKDEEAIEADKKLKEGSPFIKMGNLIDIRLTDPDNFDKFFVRTEANVPTAQMLTLCNHLYDVTVAQMDEEGNILTDFESRFELAYDLLKEGNGGVLKSKIETFAERFKVEGEAYYKERLKSRGKTIISIEEEQKSDAIVESLKNSPTTREVVNYTNRMSKFPILFDVNDIPFKMELDQMNIDHENKIIKPYDYKNTYNPEFFVWAGYLDNKYYIQGGLYKFGLEYWCSKHPEYKDYRVENMAFIVSDSNNYYSPLIFETSDEHYEQAWTGFKVGNKKYKGIYQILEELQESVELNVWNMSIENYKAGGKIKIPQFENLD